MSTKNQDKLLNNKSSEPIIQKLQEWIVNTQIPHKHSDELLKIMKESSFPSLPKCTITLLHSDVKTDVEHMEVSDGTMGEFYHFGIRKTLQDTVKVELHKSRVLELIVNIDGISPFKSSTVTVWPILIKVYTEDDKHYKPFTASVYAGNGKPKSSANYLRKFALEIQDLMSNGVTIENQLYQVKIKYFCCDTPARAFLKCILGHTALLACERCRVVGQKVKGVTVFLSVDSAMKSEDDFTKLRRLQMSYWSIAAQYVGSTNRHDITVCSGSYASPLPWMHQKDFGVSAVFVHS